MSLFYIYKFEIVYACVCVHIYGLEFYILQESTGIKAFTIEGTFYGCYFMLGIKPRALYMFNTPSLERTTLREVIF